MLYGDFARIRYKYSLAEKCARNRDLEGLSEVSCDIAEFWAGRDISDEEWEVVSGYESSINDSMCDLINESFAYLWEYALAGDKRKVAAGNKDQIAFVAGLKGYGILHEEVKKFAKQMRRDLRSTCQAKMYSSGKTSLLASCFCEDSEGIGLAMERIAPVIWMNPIDGPVRD